jgi:hypothetical protein
VLETLTSSRRQAAVIEVQFRLQPAVAGDERALGRLRITAYWIIGKEGPQRRGQFRLRIDLPGRSKKEAWIVGVANHAFAVGDRSVMQQRLPLAPRRQPSGIGAGQQFGQIGGISANLRCMEQNPQQQNTADLDQWENQFDANR